MDTETWKIENNICRCCHAEGYFFNLSEPRPFCGETEVYADMIRDIFDIDMKPVPGPVSELTYTICMSCIFKLREAIQFKKQVQRCEDKFQDFYYTNKLEVVKKRDMSKAIIKLEPVIEFKEEFFNEDDLDSNDDVNIHFEIDDDDDNGSKSDVDLEFLSKKGKGKGKGKSESVVPKAAAVKSEQRTRSKKLVKVDRIKVPVKKKDVRSSFFRLHVEDYNTSGNKFKCARCDKEYDRKATMRLHVKRKHYDILRYKCDLCPGQFTTEARLTRHRYEEHGIDDRIRCNACKGVFNTQRQLLRHQNIFHMLGEKHKCDSCDYESYSFEGLYKHKFSHKTVKDHHCKFCRKSFVRKSTLALHERIHTGDRRKICKECGKAFVQKASLNYHMARHHPEVNF